MNDDPPAADAATTEHHPGWRCSCPSCLDQYPAWRAIKQADGQRIDALRLQADELKVALRMLLEHCDPSEAPSCHLPAARKRAMDLLKTGRL